MYVNKLYLLFQTIILQSMCGFKYTRALVGSNIRTLQNNEIPYIICIAKYSSQNNNSPICSGALLTGTHVLTAEHCLDNQQNSTFEVLLRYGQPDNCPTNYPIWWISFDQWTVGRNEPVRNGNNDVAIIKIFGLGHNVIPGILSDITPLNLFYGLNVQLVGCGRTNNNQRSCRIRTGDVKVLSLNECSVRVSDIQGTNVHIPDNYICTARIPYIQTNYGDSGAPVIFAGRIIGINLGISPMNNQFHPEKVNVHLYTYLYRDFLNDVTEDNM